MSKLLCIVFLISISMSSFGQEKEGNINRKTESVKAKVQDGDTIILAYLNPVYITEDWSPRKKKKFTLFTL